MCCDGDVFAVTAAQNKQKSAAKDTAKLDRETEELHRKCVAASQRGPISTGGPGFPPRGFQPSSLERVPTQLFGEGSHRRGFMVLYMSPQMRESRSILGEHCSKLEPPKAGLKRNLPQ